MHDNRADNHERVIDGPAEIETDNQHEQTLADNLGHDSLPIAAASAALGAADSASVEGQLRAQEAFYRNIIEGAADVTTLIAPDGTILYASATMVAPTSLGYSPEEVVGRNALEIIHPDDRQGVAQAIANDLAGVPTTVEARVRKRDGSWMWVEMRGKAIIGLDGNTMVVAYSRDITERKRLEQQLKKSEEYYKSLLHGSSDLITIADQAGAVRFTSDSIQRILGYRPDEVLGRQMFSFFHEDDLARAAGWLSAAAGSPNLLVELRVRRKDGTWCLCEGTASPVTGLEDEPLLLINVRDISRRKLIEREHALLAAIVESSDDAISSIAPDLRITYWNRGAERMFGFTAAEAIGQPFTLHIPPERHAQAREIVDRIMAHPDQVVRFESSNRRKDDALIEVSTVCVAIRDSEGKVVAISGIQRDITERMRADREQALLAALVKSSEDAIISYSTDFRITSWNRGAQKLFGYTAQEALGKRPFDLYIPPEDCAMDQARLTRDLATIRENREAMRQLEASLLRKDGTRLEAMIVGCGIHDSNGKLIGLSTIIRDVTERRRVERESAALAAIVESSDDAISTTGPDLRTISWNRGAERMFGFTAAEAIGQPFTLHIPPERHAQAREILDRLVARPDEVARFESPNRRKDGALVQVSTVCFAIRDREGKVVGVSAIQRDITERVATSEGGVIAAMVNAWRREDERVAGGQTFVLASAAKKPWLQRPRRQLERVSNYSCPPATPGDHYHVPATR